MEKDGRINLRLSAAEMVAWSLKAKRAGLTLSAAIRQAMARWEPAVHTSPVHTPAGEQVRSRAQGGVLPKRPILTGAKPRKMKGGHCPDHGYTPREQCFCGVRVS